MGSVGGRAHAKFASYIHLPHMLKTLNDGHARTHDTRQRASQTPGSLGKCKIKIGQ
jgi:hypothetical protein